MTLRVSAVRLFAVVLITGSLAGCQWHGVNTLPLPGTQGRGPGSFTVTAHLADVDRLQPNSRVRVNDVTVGTVTKIQRQDWHALVTMALNADVILPANTTASLGQTSLLGSLHIELAAPADTPPQGRLHQGSVVPLAASKAYPSTEQTLAAASVLLNNGGLGQVQDITQALSTAFGGREQDLRSLLTQLDSFIGKVNNQTDDIIKATDSLNRLVGKFAADKPIIDNGLNTIPAALNVLNRERDTIVDAVDQLGKFSGLTADSVNQTKTALLQELHDLGPVLESVGNAGRSITRSLNLFTVFPFAKDTLTNWLRGDYGNVSLIVDLTLSRIDAALFTGTRWEGNLTELEQQWGRTIGVLPSPYTAANPLLAPYRTDQGP